ncbi:hypothetical protein K474DRAFT_1669785 [Panus rudis PR-1116 ss-1]|nr:hypothetical protein K474DRAFT_1669785 [Panus rudis PR-1116 ss-1]
MDPSSSTHMGIIRLDRPENQSQGSGSTSKSARAMEKEKEKADEREKAPAASKAPSTKGMRYKDKFITLREEYESVSQKRLSLERQLATANEKLKKLQNECNLLLDAVDIAATSQPTILHYLEQDPVPPQYSTPQRTFPTGGVVPAEAQHSPEPMDHHASHHHDGPPHPPPGGPVYGVMEVPNGTSANGHDHRRSSDYR